jgi:hypothetical protein
MNRGNARDRGTRPARGAGQHSQTQWRTCKGGNAERGGTFTRIATALWSGVAVNGTRTPTAPGSSAGRSTFWASTGGRSQQEASQGRWGFWGVGTGAECSCVGSFGRQTSEQLWPEHASPVQHFEVTGAEGTVGPQHCPAIAAQHHPGGSAKSTPHASARK